jgi:hypothetical protein
MEIPLRGLPSHLLKVSGVKSGVNWMGFALENSSY